MRPRRDPRAERQARRVVGGERPRFVLSLIPQPNTGRPRRDPRAQRRAATIIAGAKPRIDWQAGRAGGGISASRSEAAAQAAPQSQIRVIADPAYLVLAVPEHPGGALSDHDRELIGAARQFADNGGGAVVVLTAADVEGLDHTGADRAMTLPTGQLGDYDPEGRAAAVLAAIDSLKPRHVLFPDSPNGGADLARRVAALSGERLFAGVEAVAQGRVTRRMRGGAMEMAGAPALLMSIAWNAFSPHEGPRHEARPLDAPEISARRQIASAVPLAVEADRLALSDADFILSGGNGVTDWGSFIELGQVLGATLGGSRVVCDEGHLPRDRQVGASGSVVTARCYLAFGIAGAPQHLQGITEVQHVVAVNTDLHAEMIKRADLAIIADAQAVMPALIAHARSASAAGEVQSDVTDLPSPVGDAGEISLAVASGSLSQGERDGVRGGAVSGRHSGATLIVRTPSPPPSPPGRGSFLRWAKRFGFDREGGGQHSGEASGGRGRGAAPGDGIRPLGVEMPHIVDRSYPLTPSLSDGERLSFAVKAHDREREPEAASGLVPGGAKAVKVAVLLSVGRHPASGRPRRAPLDARALEMALSLSGAEIHAIHAGDAAEPALRDYLGMGLARLTVLSLPSEADPVPAISAHLARLAPDMILCGGRGEGGEDSGMVPYLIAEALGAAMVADVAAITLTGDKTDLTQALPRGKRRLVAARLPVVAAVNAAAPAPRQSAFARARRGIVEVLPAEAPADILLEQCEVRPWRPRPKRMRLASGGSALDRLKTMTETKSGEGAILIQPPAEEAARAIYDYLRAKRIIEGEP